MNTMCKFAVYNRDGKTRTTYRIVRTDDDDLIIQEYGTNTRKWYSTTINALSSVAWTRYSIAGSSAAYSQSINN